MPRAENPYLYIVAAGTLRLYTPSGIVDYIEGQYSHSRIDTPLHGTVLAPSEMGDFLAVSVEFTAGDVIAVAIELDNGLTGRVLDGGIGEEAMAEADREAVRSAARLLDTALGAAGSEFLRRNILREVIYYLLRGSCGGQLLRLSANAGRADKIYDANS